MNRITELGTPYHSQKDLERIDALHHKEDLYAANQILALIGKEIEKVKNDYQNDDDLAQYLAFNKAKQKILALFKEKGNNEE